MTRCVSPEVLARYGLAEPERASTTPPLRLAVPHGLEKAEQFTPAKRQAFKLLEARAVYLSTIPGVMWINFQPDGGSEVRHYGGNRGFRPLKIGTTQSWRDTATRLHDVVPYVRYGKLVHIWVANHQDALALVKAATDMLAATAENGGYELRLGHGLLNLGADGDLERLVADLRQEARCRQITTWNRTELSLLLDRALDMAKLKDLQIVDDRGRPINHPGFAKMIDKLTQGEPRSRVPQPFATRSPPPEPKPGSKPWNALEAFSVVAEKERKKAAAGPRARPREGRRGAAFVRWAVDAAAAQRRREGDEPDK